MVNVGGTASLTPPPAYIGVLVTGAQLGVDYFIHIQSN
jgi:hypothetical protein